MNATISSIATILACAAVAVQGPSQVAANRTAGEAADCARFGLMVLRKGEWRGQSIVSAEYLRESTKSSQPMTPPTGGFGGSMGPAEAFALAEYPAPVP